MEKEYNIGDKIWWAKYEQIEVKKTCPVCFGKLWVTVILGDDSKVETQCSACERGFQQYGYVNEYEYVSAVKEVTIDRKEVNETDSGRNVEYRYQHYCLDKTNSFSTKEEAEKRLAEMILEKQKEDLARMEHHKNNILHKFSWHVSYYQKQQREALKQIEWADKKIKYFRNKMKEEQAPTGNSL
jgi:hypothetical protein